MKYCPECGSKIIGIGRFCSECGTNLQPNQNQSNQEINHVPIINETKEEPQVNETVDNVNQIENFNNQFEMNQEQNTKAPKALVRFFIIVFAIEVVLLVAAIIIVAFTKMHMILLVVAGINFLTAFIMYKVYDYRLCYICPKCGTKRVKHQKYIGSTTETSSYADHTIASKTVRYTDIYWATYVCPKCGETLGRQEKRPGGSTKGYSSGRVENHNVDINEY